MTRIAVILLGINDLNAGDSAATAWSEMQTLIATAKADFNRVIVCTLPPTEQSTTVEDKVIEFNASVRAGAVTGGYEVLDLFALLIDPSDEYAAQMGLLQSDGLHLTAASNVLLADALDAMMWPIAVNPYHAAIADLSESVDLNATFDDTEAESAINGTRATVNDMLQLMRDHGWIQP